MDDSSIRRTGAWTEEEDAQLCSLVAELGTKSWTTVAARMGGIRSGKSCRLRWHNQLNPAVNKTPFTPWEQAVIVRAQQAPSFANKWAQIARLLQCRTDNAVKNHWHATLSRKAMSGSLNNRYIDEGASLDWLLANPEFADPEEIAKSATSKRVMGAVRIAASPSARALKRARSQPLPGGELPGIPSFAPPPPGPARRASSSSSCELAGRGGHGHGGGGGGGGSPQAGAGAGACGAPPLPDAIAAAAAAEAALAEAHAARLVGRPSPPLCAPPGRAAGGYAPAAAPGGGPAGGGAGAGVCGGGTAHHPRVAATWSGSFDSGATCVDYGAPAGAAAAPRSGFCAHDGAAGGLLERSMSAPAPPHHAHPHPRAHAHALAAPPSGVPGLPLLTTRGLPPLSPTPAAGGRGAGHSANTSPVAGPAAAAAGADGARRAPLAAEALSEQEERLRARVVADSSLREQLHERLQLLQRRQAREQALQALLQQQQLQALQHRQLLEQQAQLAAAQQQLHALHHGGARHAHVLLPDALALDAPPPRRCEPTPVAAALLPLPLPLPLPLAEHYSGALAADGDRHHSASGVALAHAQHAQHGHHLPLAQHAAHALQAQHAQHLPLAHAAFGGAPLQHEELLSPAEVELDMLMDLVS